LYGETAKDRELTSIRRRLEQQAGDAAEAKQLKQQMKQIELTAVESWLFAGDLTNALL
jgi:hypothetical protein